MTTGFTKRKQKHQHLGLTRQATKKCHCLSQGKIKIKPNFYKFSIGLKKEYKKHYQHIPLTGKSTQKCSHHTRQSPSNKPVELRLCHYYKSQSFVDNIQEGRQMVRFPSVTINSYQLLPNTDTENQKCQKKKRTIIYSKCSICI